jgi:hypothetical protein
VTAPQAEGMGFQDAPHPVRLHREDALCWRRECDLCARHPRSVTSLQPSTR